MVAKEHEHRNENRSEDRPFCGTGGDKDIDECAKGNECYEERNTCETDGFKAVSAYHSEHSAKFCPVEEPLELTAEETE